MQDISVTYGVKATLTVLKKVTKYSLINSFLCPMFKLIELILTLFSNSRTVDGRRKFIEYWVVQKSTY